MLLIGEQGAATARDCRYHPDNLAAVPTSTLIRQHLGHLVCPREEARWCVRGSHLPTFRCGAENHPPSGDIFQGEEIFIPNTPGSVSQSASCVPSLQEEGSCPGRIELATRAPPSGRDSVSSERTTTICCNHRNRCSGGSNREGDLMKIVRRTEPFGRLGGRMS